MRIAANTKERGKSTSSFFWYDIYIAPRVTIIVYPRSVYGSEDDSPSKNGLIYAATKANISKALELYICDVIIAMIVLQIRKKNVTPTDKMVDPDDTSLHK